MILRLRAYMPSVKGPVKGTAYLLCASDRLLQSILLAARLTSGSQAAEMRNSSQDCLSGPVQSLYLILKAPRWPITWLRKCKELSSMQLALHHLDRNCWMTMAVVSHQLRTFKCHVFPLA